MRKARLKFGQGLEFLQFGQGNRGLDQQIRRKSKEIIRHNNGKRGKNDKKYRNRGSNLLKRFLFNIFSVGPEFFETIVDIDELIYFPEQQFSEVVSRVPSTGRGVKNKSSAMFFGRQLGWKDWTHLNVYIYIYTHV